MFKNILLILLTFCLVHCSNTPPVIQKELRPVQGKIINLITKTKTLKLFTRKKTFILNYTNDTKFENFKDLSKLHLPANASIIIDNTMQAHKIKYIKKLQPGAVSIKDFVIATKTRKYQIIDVRTHKEVERGKIANAINIPLSDLGKNLSKIPKNKKVILQCASGIRAAMAYDFLKKKGFKDISYLDGSLKAVCRDNNINLRQR